MEAPTFTDLSPNANSETIDRIFRYLAQRYHPDNQETGDRLRFDAILQAHNTLKDPVKRAQYDIQHKNHSVRWKLVEEAGDGKDIQQDGDIQHKLMSVLYVKRRQDANNPGVGSVDLERLLGCETKHLEFHLWYLKEKGWIRRLDNGLLAITLESVDRTNAERRVIITTQTESFIPNSARAGPAPKILPRISAPAHPQNRHT
jgi:curved DNA-binding protein CbpA